MNPFVLYCVGFTVGFIFGQLWQVGTTKMHFSHLSHVRGYHFHHSIMGIVAFIAVPFFRDIAIIIFLVSFGLGVFIQHYVLGDHEIVSKD